MIRPQTCPICENESGSVDNRFAPFCSERCRQVDLLRWSKGQYAIVQELDPREAAILDAMEQGEIPPESMD